MPKIALLVVHVLAGVPFLSGCNNPDAVPGYSAEEQKLVNDPKNETPEQQIERINKGPMPHAAKDEMIRKIKAENNMK
ncbi:MAG: hypothetical protein MUC92_01995 [Fimbriimonadaceae bacterium]|nr:hypothetical protein [Fimbriimonadaceae bacterium]